MDQEKLIRQIMAEVMQSLGTDTVTFEKNAPGGPAPRPTASSRPARTPRASTRARPDDGDTGPPGPMSPVFGRCALPPVGAALRVRPTGRGAAW